ncbi:hypothetical protein [Stenotrophomonas sp.]|uniref:DUF4760 domain-containing protein n=1 Tax=Stenotrophomonas sp. TaxID=69392 RepID=UPI0028A00F90|nr:hypothetical protein [Stenotrophomonas sp.]
MSNFEIGTLILQSIVAVAALITVFLVIRQVGAMSAQVVAAHQASEVESILAIVAFLQREDVRTAREAVRSSLSLSHHTSWDAAQNRHASTVCANYDVVAALLRANVIRNQSIIIDNWAPSILHCHQILAPFIAAKRKIEGGRDDYWANFDWLKGVCDQAGRK